MQAQRQTQNGQSANGHGPQDGYDIQAEILRSSEDNPLLENTNLGLGNYDEGYMWQQIRSYRKGLFAYIAFSRVLTHRAIHETKVALAREGFSYYDETTDEVKQWASISNEDNRKDVLERGEDIWDDLERPNEALSKKQVAAIVKKTGIDTDWVPVNWQMVSGRHEVSRSQDAELIRDLLTGIKHIRDDNNQQQQGGILGGGQ